MRFSHFYRPEILGFTHLNSPNQIAKFLWELFKTSLSPKTKKSCLFSESYLKSQGPSATAKKLKTSIPVLEYASKKS